MGLEYLLFIHEFLQKHNEWSDKSSTIDTSSNWGKTSIDEDDLLVVLDKESIVFLQIALVEFVTDDFVYANKLDEGKHLSVNLNEGVRNKPTFKHM